MPEAGRAPRVGQPRRLGALVLGVLMLVGLAACSGSPGGGQEGFLGSATAITQVPPGEREPAPEVSGPELGGERTLSSRAYAGKVVVLNVWGSWCPPCRYEAPDLQAASVETAGRAQFLGLNTRDADPAPAEAFVRNARISYPSIYDPEARQVVKFAGDLPPSAIPSTLVIDTSGRLAARVLGPITTVTLVDLVDDVAAGR
ncbi:MAG: TlpA family protein disulfide reductase [Actinomycetes bacterium]